MGPAQVAVQSVRTVGLVIPNEPLQRQLDPRLSRAPAAFRECYTETNTGSDRQQRQRDADKKHPAFLQPALPHPSGSGKAKKGPGYRS